MFAGRKLIIATKHKKEKVISPVLEKQLGVICFTDLALDTDKLGTFSGEVERQDDPITTARNKCLMAMQLSNADMAVASEGSFGQHPSIFFSSADEEILLFIDKKNDLEIIAREISTDTNFNGSEIKTERELNEFAKRCQFPSHSLIIKKAKDDYSEIVKGIRKVKHLKSTFHYFISNYGTAYVETDMRAMNNPTRMKIIEKAAVKLAEKINSLCPHCKTPGFAITDAKRGLPCGLCNFPTRSTWCYIYSCIKCSYTKVEEYPRNKYAEDPMYCDRCNP